jgi:hypothetical protein
MARAIAAELWKGSVPSARTYCEKLLAASLSPIGITTEACSLEQVGRGMVNLLDPTACRRKLSEASWNLTRQSKDRRHTSRHLTLD